MQDIQITFIQTGGTIDKDYPKSEIYNAYKFAINEPVVRSILLHIDPTFKYEIIETLKKDSLDITKADRKKIVESVAKAPGDKIVITHGTDTMLRTAEALNSSVEAKTIVLTGAMLPEKFVTSDAEFNVGMAVGAVQTLPHGIYIALYGRIVPWQEFDALRKEYERQSRQP